MSRSSALPRCHQSVVAKSHAVPLAIELSWAERWVRGDRQVLERGGMKFAIDRNRMLDCNEPPSIAPPSAERAEHSASAKWPPPFPVGHVIAERYVVTRFVSHGATSRVYAARPLGGGGTVAIKVQRGGFGESAVQSVDRMQLEALVYSRAGSAHLPRLLDAGRLADGAPFIVMEFVSGPTLAERLEGGPLAIPAVVDLGCQLMRGLQAAHAERIVHCDIKPSNIVLEWSARRGVLLKIVDFGICTRAHAANPRLPADRIIGTPTYMAPERMRRLPIDGRADIYSAGAVLYEVLTGRPPFSGRTATEVVTAVLHDPLLPPQVLRASCPLELDELLVSMLSRDPDRRPSSASKVVDMLTRIGVERDYPSGLNAWNTRASVPPPRDGAADEDTCRCEPDA